MLRGDPGSDLEQRLDRLAGRNQSITKNRSQFSQSMKSGDLAASLATVAGLKHQSHHGPAGLYLNFAQLQCRQHRITSQSQRDQAQ